MILVSIHPVSISTIHTSTIERLVRDKLLLFWARSRLSEYRSVVVYVRFPMLWTSITCDRCIYLNLYVFVFSAYNRVKTPKLLFALSKRQVICENLAANSILYGESVRRAALADLQFMRCSCAFTKLNSNHINGVLM